MHLDMFSLYSKTLLKDLHNFVHFNLSIALLLGYTTFLAGIESATGNDASLITPYIVCWSH